MRRFFRPSRGADSPPIAVSLRVVLLLLAVPAPSSGQEVVLPADTVLAEVRLVDGTEVVGWVEPAGDSVAVRLVSGDVLRVPEERVASVRPAPGRVREGRYFPPDPNVSRLFFGPTARTPPAGSGYLALFEVVIPFVSVAVTDHLILAGGTPFISGLDDPRPFWIAPKLRVWSRGTTDVAVGVLALRAGDEDLGVLYGVGTLGDGDAAVTTGIGYGYTGGDLAETPALMLGGEIRVSSTVKLLAEGYGIDGEGIVAVGPRFFGDRLSGDVGAAFLLGSDGFVPVVNLVYTW